MLLILMWKKTTYDDVPSCSLLPVSLILLFAKNMTCTVWPFYEFFQLQQEARSPFKNCKHDLNFTT